MTALHTAKAGLRRTQRAAAVALTIMLLLAATTLWDEAFVLWLALYPEQIWSLVLNRLLLAGPVQGVPVVVVLPFLVATLIHLLARKSATESRLSRWRGAAGYLMVSGVATAMCVFVADRLMARALPIQVLAGDTVFVPWFALLETPPRGIASEIAGGNTAATAWLGSFAFIALAKGSKRAAVAILAISLLLTGSAGIAAISAQTAWPFDVALSAILGYLVPALLVTLSIAAPGEGGPTGFTGRLWRNHPAAHGGWAVRFSAHTIGLGISGALIGTGLRWVFLGNSWLHLAIGLTALLFFGWRLRGLVRPYLPTRETVP